MENVVELKWRKRGEIEGGRGTSEGGGGEGCTKAKNSIRKSKKIFYCGENRGKEGGGEGES